jgi:DNA polymerase III alpha subunit
MTLELNNTDKLSEFRAEAQRLGIKVEAPNINRSGATFEVGEKTIYYALAALKGVGQQAIDQIVEERKKGVFTSLATSPRGSIRARSTSASSRASPRPAPSTRSNPTAPVSLPARRRSCRLPAQP